MRVWTGVVDAAGKLGETAVAIGTFDGLHLGHRAVIAGAASRARQAGLASAVLTFDRHPSALIEPTALPGALSTPSQRAEVIAGLGIDHLIITPFDQLLRAMSPQAFAEEILAHALNARTVHVGQGFRFGREQSGDTETMARLGLQLGFVVHTEPEVLIAAERVSSSRIRTLLREGRVTHATGMISQPYQLRGTVVHGQHLGRTLGFPTANLRTGSGVIIPGNGIYAVLTDWGDGPRMGACAVGTRPTVGGVGVTVETFVLDFDGDLYGLEMNVSFIARLRDELKFPSIEALVEQMHRDVADTRTILTPIASAGEHQSITDA